MICVRCRGGASVLYNEMCTKCYVHVKALRTEMVASRVYYK